MRRADFFRRLAAFVVVLLVAVPAVVSAENLTCGLRPIPALGCEIGRCAYGA
jgi:hypothetical protein